MPTLGASYLPVLAAADVLVGNSSSGIFEAASFGVPVVDVGDRQRGRERDANVCHAPEDRAAIEDAIRTCLTPAFREQAATVVNRYGDGKAAPRIVEVVRRAVAGGLARKPFVDSAGPVTATPIWVLGGGGQARETQDLIAAINRDRGEFDVRGLVDEAGEALLADESGALVLGVGWPGLRRTLLDRFTGRFSFPVLVHPAADVGAGTELGAGVVVSSGCVVTTDVRLGAGTLLNPRSGVGHDSTIGRCCVVNPGANISGAVTIGDRVLIGSGATVLQGLSIGDDAVDRCRRGGHARRARRGDGRRRSGPSAAEAGMTSRPHRRGHGAAHGDPARGARGRRSLRHRRGRARRQRRRADRPAHRRRRAARDPPRRRNSPTPRCRTPREHRTPCVRAPGAHSSST